MSEPGERKIATIVERSEAGAYSSLIRAGGDGLSRKHGFGAARVGSAAVIMAGGVTASLNLNRVIGLGIEEPADEGMLDAIEAHYARLGVSYAIEWSPAGRPDTVVDWMKKRRLRGSLNTAMFHRRVGEVTPADTGLEVHRTGKSHAGALAEICCESFRMPEAVAELLAATVDEPGWCHWIAFDGKEPAAAALSYMDPPLAWLGWDATRPAYRGRRAQQALIAARVNAAAEAGCEHATSETLFGTAENPDPSYRNYERLGFACGYARRTWVALRRPARR